MNKIEEAYADRSMEVAGKRGTIYKIVLYKDGKVSRDVAEREYEDVLYNIPIPPYYYNKKSRLLFCYSDGHVNVMTPKDLLNSKLRRPGLKSNGYKIDTQATLMQVMVCLKDDFLVVCSYGGDGKKYIKAMPLENRTPHGSMHASGNIFVQNARPYKWVIVPKTLKNTIADIKSPSSGIGFPQENHEYLATALMEQNEAAMELQPCPVVQLLPKT